MGSGCKLFGYSLIRPIFFALKTSTGSSDERELYFINTEGDRTMSRTSSSRIILITSFLIALAAFAVNVNWGRVFGFSLFASNAEAQTAGGSLPALSGTRAIEYLKQNRQYES